MNKKTFGSFIFFAVLSSSIGAAESDLKALKDFPPVAYHSLKSGNKTVGKTDFSWKQEAQNKLRFVENSEIKLTLFQKLQSITTKLSLTTNEKLEIQNFIYTMKTNEADISIEGERTNSNTIRMKVSQGGKTQVKTLSLQEPVLMSATIRPYILLKGLPKEKSHLEALVLEPSALTTVPLALDLTKKVQKNTAPKISAEKYEVAVNYLSHTLKSEIDQSGALLSEKSDFAGLPIEASPLKSEKDYKELKIEGTSDDLVERAKVNFPKIDKPREIKKLAVKITGIDLQKFDLKRHRQTLNGNTLTISVEDQPKSGIPFQALAGSREFERYLEGDTSTPVYDPQIQRQAKAIVGDEKDLWKRALLVKDFVYKTLEKIPTISVPNALEVLATKRGDCNEHSVLYTALARAAGIPTRTVVGLVYSDRGVRSLDKRQADAGFYYHAWVEVYTGTAWIAIDPTWNEVPSDATHIAFVEGGLDQQVQVTALMGKIKLSPASSI